MIELPFTGHYADAAAVRMPPASCVCRVYLKLSWQEANTTDTHIQQKRCQWAMIGSHVQALVLDHYGGVDLACHSSRQDHTYSGCVLWAAAVNWCDGGQQ